MIGELVTQQDVAGELSLECGVVIVGSGAGGATVAAELAEAGVDVIVIEEGGYHPTESFTTGTGRALRTLYRDAGGGMAVGRPSVLYTEGRCVGGSTVVNGGMSWRTPDRVLWRLRSAINVCYYELPEVQREIGYDPAPYVAAVSRRRLESYGQDIRAGEAAVTARPERDEP